jgi:hypothetical protein
MLCRHALWAIRIHALAVSESHGTFNSIAKIESILEAAGHIILTPANQLLVMEQRILNQDQDQPI